MGSGKNMQRNVNKFKIAHGECQMMIIYFLNGCNLSLSLSFINYIVETNNHCDVVHKLKSLSKLILAFRKHIFKGAGNYESRNRLVY